MARKLKNNGLYSIMQVAKRAYWPRGMPVTDIVQDLGQEYGSRRTMKSTMPGEHLFVTTYWDLKTKVLISTCSSTVDGGERRFRGVDGQVVEVIRPRVFDDYETNKSK